MRFSAGLKSLKDALSAILPQSAGEAALRLGPEAGFAVISAAMAPEGATVGDRVGLALEDLLIGTGSSFLGSGLGRLGGKAIYDRKRTELGDDLYKEKLAQEMPAGDILAAPLPMLAPRPIATGVYERAMEGQSKQEQEQLLAQEEERLMQEALVNSLLTGGGALLT